MPTRCVATPPRASSGPGIISTAPPARNPAAEPPHAATVPARAPSRRRGVLPSSSALSKSQSSAPRGETPRLSFAARHGARRARARGAKGAYRYVIGELGEPPAQSSHAAGSTSECRRSPSRLTVAAPRAVPGRGAGAAPGRTCRSTRAKSLRRGPRGHVLDTCQWALVKHTFRVQTVRYDSFNMIKAAASLDQ